MTFFYDDDFILLKTRLEREIAKLQPDVDCYDKIIDFLVVAEDHRYFHHPGFDVLGICRAIYRNTFQGKMEGASTIEQQLVRVLVEDYRYSYKRKIKEIYLASRLREIADKKTLASVYLEIANYGTDYKGLASILNKFNTNIHEDLPNEVCADVIARLKYPEPRVSNTERIAQIEQRKRHILRLYSKTH